MFAFADNKQTSPRFATTCTTLQHKIKRYEESFKIIKFIKHGISSHKVLFLIFDSYFGKYTEIYLVFAIMFSPSKYYIKLLFVIPWYCGANFSYLSFLLEWFRERKVNDGQLLGFVKRYHCEPIIEGETIQSCFPISHNLVLLEKSYVVKCWICYFYFIYFQVIISTEISHPTHPVDPADGIHSVTSIHSWFIYSLPASLWSNLLMTVAPSFPFTHQLQSFGGALCL